MNAPKLDQFEWHRRLVRDGDLTPTERLVALALWDHYDPQKDDAVYPGRSRLADEMNLSKSTVDRSLKALREAGWIVRVRRGSSNGRRRLADEYRLTYPPRPGMKSTHDQSAPVTSDPARNSRHPCVDQSSPMRRTVSTSDDPTDHAINHQQTTAPAPALTVINGGFGTAGQRQKSVEKESLNGGFGPAHTDGPGGTDPWTGQPLTADNCEMCHGGFGCPDCAA